MANIYKIILLKAGKSVLRKALSYTIWEELSKETWEVYIHYPRDQPSKNDAENIIQDVDKSICRYKHTDIRYGCQSSRNNGRK